MTQKEMRAKLAAAIALKKIQEKYPTKNMEIEKIESSAQENNVLCFNIKRTVLLSSLKVLQQVLPVARNAQKDIMMKLEFKKRSLTLSCTISNVTPVCDCEGEGSIWVGIKYFKRIVEDEKNKVINCSFDGKTMHLNNKSFSGTSLFGN